MGFYDNKAREIFESMVHNGYLNRDDVQRAIDDLEALNEDVPEGEDSTAVVEAIRVLREFDEEVDDCCTGWIHGDTVVARSEWTDYVVQYAEDIGAVQPNMHWPPVDWTRAADELEMDWSSVELEFDGHEYEFLCQ